MVRKLLLPAVVLLFLSGCGSTRNQVTTSVSRYPTWSGVTGQDDDGPAPARSPDDKWATARPRELHGREIARREIFFTGADVVTELLAQKAAHHRNPGGVARDRNDEWEAFLYSLAVRVTARFLRDVAAELFSDR